MSDPLRTDPSRANEPASDAAASDADREAKIEQLLLVGLDHYLSARYEDAINVWTRALFFDRSHARARAYIERARSALAERQRESEELLQHGVAAYDRGEAEEARRLLREAIDQGAPSEEALAILDRLNRLDRNAAADVPVDPTARRRPRPTAPEPASRGSRAAWTGFALLLLVILAAAAFGAGVFRSDWRSLLDRRSPPSAAAPARFEPSEQPSVPRRGELALARARALMANGRLRDALSALDLVQPTDPQKPEADRLRSDMQKQLIDLGRVSMAGPPVEKGAAPEP